MGTSTELSRREFAALAAAAPLALARQASTTAAVSALEVVERIKRQIGVDWKPDTVDGIKAGDPATARHRHRDDVDAPRSRCCAKR